MPKMANVKASKLANSPKMTGIVKIIESVFYTTVLNSKTGYLAYFKE
jgi:hypothetical protein